MEMHVLEEGAAGGRAETRVANLPSSRQQMEVSSSEDDTSAHVTQLRVLSRQSSVAILDSSAPDDDAGEKARGKRRRTSSARPPAQPFFCSVNTCARSTQGFSRRVHLARHMNLVHGERVERPHQGETLEAQSQDEMFGAVHVDGFLRPIKTRKGWRAEDITKRSGRSRSRSRPPSEAVENSDDQMETS